MVLFFLLNKRSFVVESKFISSTLTSLQPININPLFITGFAYGFFLLPGCYYRVKFHTKSNNLNINKNIISYRKYSTSLKNKNNLINTNNLNNLKLNNNMFVSSVIYNNAEEDKLIILADTKNKAVYLWTHLESSKEYIGSSVNLSRRLSSYYFSKNIARYKKSKIHNALLSYGYSAFSLTILEYIDLVNLPRG
jgi:hypothetical protein